MKSQKIAIRIRIILAFFIFAAVSGTIWGLSYYNLVIMKQKLELINQKDSLFNTILEARRYEKNYFLNRDIGHLVQAREYAVQAESKMRHIYDNLGKYAISKNLEDNIEDIRLYISLLDSHMENARNGAAGFGYEEFQNKLRDVGKEITSYLEKTVNRERRYVNELFKQLELYLFVSLTAIAVLIIAMAIFLYYFINLPLKTIEEAISKITSGDYSLIPKLSKDDEFESFVDSLNQMIFELNRRGEQLVQSEKMASLGTLTSGVAHELNNPLNNISTSLQILIEEIDEDNLEFKKQLLMEAEHEVDRARDIVKALLEFSRKQSFVMKRYNFKSVVDSTMRLIKGEVPSNIDIEIDIPDDIEAFFDQKRIKQVLINLIMNGVHAMNGKGGELKLKSWKHPEGESFTFTVEDTGEGIPEGRLSKIFDPFFTTKDVGKGSGLGLSVTHGIIDQHGGRIRVNSKPGEGSLFSVELPLRERNNGETE